VSSAHHWGRELQGLGHTVRLIPPSYVKAYLKRGKNDANDAAAICEAVTRPSMRFVPIKTKEQQTALMLASDAAIAGAPAHGILGGLGRFQELGIYVNAALASGATVDEIKEALVQITVYCGTPAGRQAFLAAHDALKPKE
jgi:Carboxymuconolactone decarboxylase family